MRRPFWASTKLTTPPSSADPAEAQGEPNGSQAVEKTRWTTDGTTTSADRIAIEEPLEVRVRGQSLAVLMRTPGDERALIAGFLASEALIRGPDDLLAVEACRDPETGGLEANVWNAALAEGVRLDPERSRFAVVGSACGLCGARTLDELERHLPALPPLESLPASFLVEQMDVLTAHMAGFRATGGVHGAALVLLDGQLLSFAEDVGRHNAVDKVLGSRLLADEYPMERPALLLVSGRLSFELVQKAALAGVAGLAGLGAPTSMAVDAAHRSGLALFGLVKPQGLNQYTGATRRMD